MEIIISRIRHGDLQAHFTNDAKGVEGGLNRTMNEALCNFRKRYREAIVSEGENTAIQITDHGAGMEPLVLEKIFVPFYTTKMGGSGIGLSLSRQMVVRHKGVITVDSEVGKGTTFTIYIPEKGNDSDNC